MDPGELTPKERIRAQETRDLYHQHRHELEQLERRQAGARLELAHAHALELEAAKRRHRREVAQLWQRQGRTLGPALAALVERKEARRGKAKR